MRPVASLSVWFVISCGAAGTSAPGTGSETSAAASESTADTSAGPPPGGTTTGAETMPASEGTIASSGGLTTDALDDSGPAPGGECPAGAVLCESFEDTTVLDPSRWEISGTADGVFVDVENASHGAHSLHARMGTAYGLPGASAARLLQGVSAPDDRIYARWYMRFGDMSLPGYHPNLVFVTGPDYDIGHWWDFATLSFGTFLSEFSVNAFGLGLDGAKLWTEPDNEVLPDFGGDTTPQTEHGIAAGEWFCVEWMLYGDHQGPDDTSHPDEEDRVWINGEEIPDLLGNDEIWGVFSAPEHWSPIYDGSRWTFGIGGAYPQGPTLDVWFDAIVFAHAPIGC